MCSALRPLLLRSLMQFGKCFNNMSIAFSSPVRQAMSNGVQPSLLRKDALALAAKRASMHRSAAGPLLVHASIRGVQSARFKASTVAPLLIERYIIYNST